MNMQLEDVVETMRNAKERGKKCCFLIGAGCSVSAEIPTADGFIEIIKEKYPVAYEKVKQKTYKKCMAILSEDERHDLIAEYVDHSKINWGHIALAQLMKEGFVDRVLTTNFDSILLRACALIGGILPAVYDIPSSKEFIPSKVSTPAIFHLHGQRSSAFMINTDEDIETLSALIEPVVRDVLDDHVWIVVGYSGENDPTIEILVKNEKFKNRLYWVGYKDNEPTEYIKSKLFTGLKDAHFIRGFDSDGFFCKLAGKLDCFPPDFLRRPFTYLNSLFLTLSDYSIDNTNEPIDFAHYAQVFIQKAINDIECIYGDVLQAKPDLMGEKYEKVLGLLSKYPHKLPEELEYPISMALVQVTNQIIGQSKNMTDEGIDNHFQLADEKYSEVLTKHPYLYLALNGWGCLLSDAAISNKGEKADNLFNRSYEKFDAALKINPKSYTVLNNWAYALSEQAKTKNDDEADELFLQAYDKFDSATKIKPDYQAGYNNWGIALRFQAMNKTGNEADILFNEAYEKYSLATDNELNYDKAYNNWGNALAAQARTKGGKRANDLFNLACSKFNNAQVINPDKPEMWDGWGVALMTQSIVNRKDKKTEILLNAIEKFDNAEKLVAGFSSYNLACAFSLLHNSQKCQEWLEKSLELKALPSYDYIIKDSFFHFVRNQDWFKCFLNQVENMKNKLM